MSNEYLNNRTFEKLIINFQETKKNKLKYEILHEDVEIHKKNSKDKVLFIPLTQPLEAQKNHLEAQTELAKAFYTLSENIVKYAKFSHIDQDDSIQEGVVICFERAEKFDPAKGKAFNYMTTCILNHFKQLYRAARNYQELKRRINDMYQKSMSSTYSMKIKESYYRNNNFDND
jgi:hypothetical protein